jgi:4-amino-4-deoxy-L-arabinose transferase-like glycosyltransferase
LLIAATLLLLAGIVAAQESKGAGGEGMREWPRKWLLLGLMLGLGFLTKATVYILVPLIGIVLLWRYWGQWPMLWRSAILVFGPAALLGLLWWGRNAFVYGGMDILGTAAHNAVVVGQPRTSEWIAERGVGPTIAALARTTFQSFWGQFGWMGVVMPNWVYQPLLLFSLLALVGLLFAFAANRRSLLRGGFDVLADVRPPALLILAGTLALSMLLFLGYNVTFVQHQGRYLFPALIPIAIGVAAGWGFWLSPASRRWPKAAYILPIVLCLSLFALDLLALYRFIVPSLS